MRQMLRWAITGVAVGMTLFAVLAGTTRSMAHEPHDERTAIVTVLKASAAAWSKNDLAGFMSAYESASTTTYLKGDTVIHGYDAIKSMYAARFGSDPGSMGQLSLTVVEVRPLGAAYALCIGKFTLALPTTPAKSAGGIFTLVFHHTPAGWKIVSDHTSS